MLARACAAAGVPLIHISTDYVFDGTKQGAYVETDPIAPLGVYGRTKADGEAAVRDTTAPTRHPAHLLGLWRVRHNFLKTVLRLARARELRIVADQFGCPTSTGDLAQAIFAMRRGSPRARISGAPIISRVTA